MGLTHIRARVANPAHPRRGAQLRFLVDSGAVYSLAPASILRKLGIRPHSSRTFLLADGSEITRAIGDAIFVLDDHRAASPVIFGEEDDAALLGTVSLESLGLVLDPMKRVLRPLPMVLGRVEPHADPERPAKQVHAGVPRARRVPLRPRAVRRRPGGSKGRIWIAPDFDAPFPQDLLDGFKSRVKAAPSSARRRRKQ